MVLRRRRWTFTAQSQEGQILFTLMKKKITGFVLIIVGSFKKVRTKHKPNVNFHCL